jgi:hypothetical protein
VLSLVATLRQALPSGPFAHGTPTCVQPDKTSRCQQAGAADDSRKAMGLGLRGHPTRVFSRGRIGIASTAGPNPTRVNSSGGKTR